MRRHRTASKRRAPKDKRKVRLGQEERKPRRKGKAEYRPYANDGK